MSALVIVLVVVLVMAVLVCGLLAALLIPAVMAAREAAQAAQASNNLKQVALAMHNYSAAYKSLPASHAVDYAENPTVSWRVPLLPFMEAMQVSDRVDYNSSWDSPANSQIHSMMPAMYRHPGVAGEQPIENSNIFVIRHPQSVFPDGPTYRKFHQVVDGTSNTLAFVMLKNHSRHWMDTAGIGADEMYDLIQQEERPEKVLVAWVDGSVNEIGPVTREQFMAMVTIDGGEMPTR